MASVGIAGFISEDLNVLALKLRSKLTCGLGPIGTLLNNESGTERGVTERITSCLNCTVLLLVFVYKYTFSSLS